MHILYPSTLSIRELPMAQLTDEDVANAVIRTNSGPRGNPIALYGRPVGAVRNWMRDSPAFHDDLGTDRPVTIAKIISRKLGEKGGAASKARAKQRRAEKEKARQGTFFPENH